MPIDEGAQNSFLNIQQTINLQTIRITGCGKDSNTPTSNYRQQTDAGPYVGNNGDFLKYVVDTEGGSSGSPIIDDLTGMAVGIHTSGYCNGPGHNGGTSFYNTDFWEATGLGIDYTVDQIDEDDDRLIGTNIGRWESFSFRDYILQNEPFPFSAEEETFETLRADQNTVSNPKQKYNNWLDVSNIVNHRKVLIDAPYLFTSKFRKTYPGIVIQNYFLDAPSLNPDDDILGFKDPWFIDYPDPDYGSNRRNRGMDDSGNDKLIFRDRTSPFYPDFENTFEYNQEYNGVFLDQTLAGGIYYSVRSPLVQNFQLSQTGKYHNFYFQNWSWDGTDPLTQNNIVNEHYETPVVFRSGSATVTANLKGTQLSNNANAYKNNSQRKFIRTEDGPNGKLYITYESMGYV
jgi:hypothetical protein